MAGCQRTCPARRSLCHPRGQQRMLGLRDLGLCVHSGTLLSCYCEPGVFSELELAVAAWSPHTRADTCFSGVFFFSIFSDWLRAAVLDVCACVEARGQPGRRSSGAVLYLFSCLVSLSHFICVCVYTPCASMVLHEARGGRWILELELFGAIDDCLPPSGFWEPDSGSLQEPQML